MRHRDAFIYICAKILLDLFREDVELYKAACYTVYVNEDDSVICSGSGISYRYFK